MKTIPKRPRRIPAGAILSGGMALLLLALAWPAVAAPVEQVWRMELPVEVKPGETANLRITSPEGIVPQAKYTAVLMLPGQSGRALQMGFFDPEGKTSKLATEAELTGGAPLPLRVLAGRCSPAGDFEGEIRLIPQYDRLADQPVLPVHIVVRVHVQPDRAVLPACYAPFVKATSRGLLMGFVTMFLFAMITHTHFLKSRHLVQRLALLRKDTSEFVKVERAEQEIRHLVKRDLRLGRRVMAWLKANPLKIGLLGGSYSESVELYLAPGPHVSSSFLSLSEEKDLLQKLQKDPGHRDRLLAASSPRRLSLFAVLKGNELGRFRLRSNLAEGPRDRYRLIRLETGDRLEQDPEDPWDERTLYGWAL